MRPATMVRHPTPPKQPGQAGRSTHLRNTWNLGLKEFRSLSRDLAMVFLIVFMFSASIYADARAKPESLSRAAIAVVDEDGSQLSARIVAALQPPQFLPPEHVGLADMDRGLDAGRHTFVLDIPPNFQRDVLAGRSPALQLNIDATRQGQAQTGAAYIQNILADEVRAFVQRMRAPAPQPVELVPRAMFNPNLEASWFGKASALVTLAAGVLVLAGALASALGTRARLALGAALVFLGVDDLLAIHERVGWRLAHAVGGDDDVLRLAWPIAYLPFLGVAALLLLRARPGLPRREAKLRGSVRGGRGARAGSG